MVVEIIMVKLIKGLIVSGVLKFEDGQVLLVQVQVEVVVLQYIVVVGILVVSGGVVLEVGDVCVLYVLQSVCDGICDEVCQEVMMQVRFEGWVVLNEVVEWIKCIKVIGDMWVCSELCFFFECNSDIVSNWLLINFGNGFDINININLQLLLLLNICQDCCNLWCICVCLGIEVIIGQYIMVGVCLVSGSSNGLVLMIEQLGGGLSKKDVWLDQVWLVYSLVDWVMVCGGCFGNLFWISDMLFFNDLNFDGLVVNLQYDFDDGDFGLFGNLVVVLLEYIFDSVFSQSWVKMLNENKWLFGVQVGVGWCFNDDNVLCVVLGYYDFKNISGCLFLLCVLYVGVVGCDMDWLCLVFMQKGNILMLICDIVCNLLDLVNMFILQYVGLVLVFCLVMLNLCWDMQLVQGIGLCLDGDYICNLVYDKQKMFICVNNGIVNNYGVGGIVGIDMFCSGDIVWMVQVIFGVVDLKEKGQWQVLLGYKCIEVDVLLDVYNDLNFYFGGINVRGYYVGGVYVLDVCSWISGKWMVVKEVFGVLLLIDVFQLEFNIGF